MNTTQLRFNAPIPEFSPLSFLFYRWGYDQIEAGKELFKSALVQHFYYEGLELYEINPSDNPMNKTGLLNIEGLDLELSRYFVKRNNLIAVEQKTGFLNHGLKHKEIELYAPHYVQHQRMARFNNHNNKTRLTADQVAKTLDEAKRLKYQHPSWKKIAIEDAVADALQTTRKTVDEHIQKAIYFNLLTDEEEKFFKTKKRVEKK